MLTRTLINDTYPLKSLQIPKPCRFKDADELVEALLVCIEDHPTARLIAVFDHFAHTRDIHGDIAPNLIAASNVIFCFGLRLPGPEVMALRPRSIGITELTDRFVVNFMEAPTQEAEETMTNWVCSLSEEGS